jgi:hypothetical protein
MRPSRWSTHLAVPAFPDGYGQDRFANARATERIDRSQQHRGQEAEL